MEYILAKKTQLLFLIILASNLIALLLGLQSHLNNKFQKQSVYVEATLITLNGPKGVVFRGPIRGEADFANNTLSYQSLSGKIGTYTSEYKLNLSTENIYVRNYSEALSDDIPRILKANLKPNKAVRLVRNRDLRTLVLAGLCFAILFLISITSSLSEYGEIHDLLVGHKKKSIELKNRVSELSDDNVKLKAANQFLTAKGFSKESEIHALKHKLDELKQRRESCLEETPNY